MVISFPSPSVLFDETIDRGSGPTCSGLSMPNLFSFAEADIYKCYWRKCTPEDGVHIPFFVTAALKEPGESCGDQRLGGRCPAE